MNVIEGYINIFNLIVIGYKLVACIMTSNKINITNIKIYIKQYLNRFYQVDKLIKIVTNNKNATPY